MEKKEVVHLLRDLIRFPSISGEEKELADRLEFRIRKTGLLNVERFEDNLLLTLGAGTPFLLLNSHSDVVPPSDRHEGDPFDPVIKKGRVHGRGSTDAKGSVSSMVTALLGLAKKGYKPTGRVSLAITVCEERYAEKNGMNHLRKILPEPDAALVGEPTELHPCGAQKGLLIVTLETKGTSGHAARATGPNAIYEMSVLLEKLRNISFGKLNPLLGSVRITPTVIEGGSARNAHPESCIVYLDIRTIPDYSNDHIIKKLQTELGAHVSIFSDRFVATQTDPGHPIARAACEVTGHPLVGSETSSDWVALADIPTIKIGPGRSIDSHTAGESIALEQLELAVPVYQNIIRRYFEHTTELLEKGK